MDNNTEQTLLYRIDTTDHTFYVTGTSNHEAREKAAALWDLGPEEFDRVGVTPMCPVPWLNGANTGQERR